MKKILKFAIPALLVVVLLTAVLTACDDKPGDDKNNAYFSVTIDYNSERGTITLSPAQSESGYISGSTVEVTAVAKDGYVVNKVTANGTELTRNNDKYAFVIDKNTSLSVLFVKDGNCSVTIKNDIKDALEITPSDETVAPLTEITIVAKTQIEYILINGERFDFVNKTVKYTVTDDVEIFAVFDTMSNAIFSSLQGRLRINGSYKYDSNENDFVHLLETVYGDDEFSSTETDAETGEVYYDAVYKKEGRRIAKYVRTADNKVVLYTSDNSLFENFYNPFDLLEASDFAKISDTEYLLADSEKAKTAATAITSWNESLASFKVTVDAEGKAIKLDIVTKEITVYETVYVSTYTLTISEHGTASVDPFKKEPYPRTEDHDALENALKEANQAPFYTIRHQDHIIGYEKTGDDEIDSYFEDLDYKVYVNDSMIFDSYKNEKQGEYPFGFKTIERNSSSYVYPFNLDVTGQVVLTDPVSVTSIADLQANFEGFKVEMFKKIGDGVYTLHSNDFASAIAPFLGEGEEQKQYAYAKNLTITLKDGKLYQITLKTSINGESLVTLTYDFMTPFDEKEDLKLDFENARKTSILDPFLGQYIDSEKNTLTVSKSGFIFNGEELEYVSYSKGDAETPAAFVCLYKGVEVSISKFSSKQILIQSEDLKINYTLNAVNNDTVSVPKEMHGVWTIDNEKEKLNYTLEIQTHVVYCNGEPVNILSYDVDEGLTIDLGNDTTLYIFNVVDEDDAKSLYAMILYKDNTFVRFYIDYVGANTKIEIPEDFVGIFEDATGNKVVVTYNKITVNGETFVPTSYDEESGFVGTLGSNTSYTIAFLVEDGVANKDKLVISGSDNQLVRKTSVKGDYVGTWTAESEFNIFDTDGKTILKKIPYTITVVFTDTSLTINGTTYPINFDSKNEYGYIVEDLDLKTDGIPVFTTTVYILKGINVYGNAFMVAYDDASFIVNLTKLDLGKVPAGMVGNWSGKDAATDKGVSAIIDKDGNTQIKFDGQTDYTSVNTEYNDIAKTLTFVYDGMKWLFSYDENTKTMRLTQTEKPFDATLTNTGNINMPQRLFGKWVDDKGNSFEIHEQYLVFKKNGADEVKIFEATVAILGTGLSQKYEFDFYVGDKLYNGEYGTYGYNILIQQQDDREWYLLSPEVSSEMVGDWSGSDENNAVSLSVNAVGKITMTLNDEDAFTIQGEFDRKSTIEFKHQVKVTDGDTAKYKTYVYTLTYDVATGSFTLVQKDGFTLTLTK